ncbi:ribosomal-protein-alanine N-acetyltransferase [Marinobacter halodurans]|uniref:[Ribosomal protein bS18]-alanine N-acetyltransferase n=1 Tax=Marinobacter halodurans TaxID=2528979 RepID=A0ABY1ZQ30_9GAMM|nr:ribosomal protein S18-alanine N-acetyltransferase [Marinobacter halodurans]TBW56277.1 ribosomal-protein-alanine N-acetyltransferase [Marinobacter halodurans]
MEPEQSYRQVASATRRIRSLAPTDIPDILSIELTGYSHPWSEAIFRDCFRPDYRLWGLADGDGLQGYAVVAYLFDEAHLLNLCVGARWRGSGAGRLLLRHLIRESFREHMQRVLLEVRRSNAIAIDLYKTEGFVQIGERPGYYPASPVREDALVLALEGPEAG